MITHDQDNRIRWVSPFGNRGIKACSQLPHAYRSVPRPSSPVCAKASTNCPYLTLESPHHQRQHWIGISQHETRQSSVAQYLGVDVHFSALLEAPHLSGQPDGTCCFRFVPALAPTDDPKTSCENQRRHGIDLKNPFTMSKSSRLAPQYCSRRADLVASSFGYWWSLSGSNRRPQACKASALPTELRPRICLGLA